jgi:hypothetical protein
MRSLSATIQIRQLLVVLTLGFGGAITFVNVVVGQAAASGALDKAAATMFSEAEADRANGRNADAMLKYQRLAAEYPASQPWAARSRLESARTMVAEGRWEPAMRQMQDVRLLFPELPEATTALERNTILHRLRLRGESPAFRRVAGPQNSPQVKGVLEVAVDSGNRVYVVMKKALALIENDVVVSSLPGDDYRAIALHGDAPILFEERAFHEAGGAPKAVAVPDQNRQREPDIQAGAVGPGDTLLLADRRTKGIHRFSMSGTHQSRLASIDAIRIAAGPQGQVAAIERETRAVLFISHDGAAPVMIPMPTSQLRNPVDLGFDALGHLYVLGRDSVAVFAPTRELLLVFAPGDTIGTFRNAVALGIDTSGRLYIYDEASERLQIYQ